MRDSAWQRATLERCRDVNRGPPQGRQVTGKATMRKGGQEGKKAN